MIHTISLATYTLSCKTLNCFTFQPNRTIFKKAEGLRPLNLQAAVIFVYAFSFFFLCVKNLGFVNDLMKPTSVRDFEETSLEVR